MRSLIQVEKTIINVHKTARGKKILLQTQTIELVPTFFHLNQQKAI